VFGVDLGSDILGLPRARQVNPDRGALTKLAVDLDMSARLLDEAVHHAEAESGSLSLGLVVKNGSNTRSTRSAGIPLPVSLTASITYCPGTTSEC